MSMEWFSYTNVSRPIDFARFTPDAVVRAAQQELGVTADGVFGERTKSALLARAQRDRVPAATIEAIRALRPGELLTRTAWAYMASLGLARAGFPIAADNPIQITAGEPMFSRPRAVTPPPAPRSSTPASTPGSTPTPAPQGGASPASLAGSMAEFYRNNKSLVLVGGAGALLLAGVGVYLATRDKDEDEDTRRPQLPPGMPRRPMDRSEMASPRPMPRPMPRPSVEERPSAASSVARAANILGIRSDADVSSIRAAYAREVGKYPRSDADAVSRRGALKAARDTMLRARGAV